MNIANTLAKTLGTGKGITRSRNKIQSDGFLNANLKLPRLSINDSPQLEKVKRLERTGTSLRDRILKEYMKEELRRDSSSDSDEFVGMSILQKRIMHYGNTQCGRHTIGYTKKNEAQYSPSINSIRKMKSNSSSSESFEEMRRQATLGQTLSINLSDLGR